MVQFWETSGTTTKYTWIYEKHVAVAKNLEHNDVAHVNYKKHDSVVKNLEYVDVIHVD